MYGGSHWCAEVLSAWRPSNNENKNHLRAPPLLVCKYLQWLVRCGCLSRTRHLSTSAAMAFRLLEAEHKLRKKKRCCKGSKDQIYVSKPQVVFGGQPDLISGRRSTQRCAHSSSSMLSWLIMNEHGKNGAHGHTLAFSIFKLGNVASCAPLWNRFQTECAWRRLDWIFHSNQSFQECHSLQSRQWFHRIPIA